MRVIQTLVRMEVRVLVSLQATGSCVAVLPTVTAKHVSDVSSVSSLSLWLFYVYMSRVSVRVIASYTQRISDLVYSFSSSSTVTMT